MTDDMEERLREALRDRARVPVTAGDPVVGVQARMRRRTYRRGLAVASTAAICVAGIATAATALTGNNTSSRPIGPTISSSNPPSQPSQTPTKSARSPVKSAEASAPAPPFSVPVTTPIPAASLPSNVLSLELPSGNEFSNLTTDSGQLQVTGTIPIPSTTLPAHCVALSISGNPPAVGGSYASNCVDPASVGEQVTLVVTEKPDAKSDSGVSGTIAISHRDSASGGFTIGPVIMKYTSGSDTRPVSVYGGGSLWIYDLSTSNGPEAIQISATTGQVEDVVRTPALSRPIIAANSDGLWLGNSIEGSIVAGTVFHVASGSHVVTTVVASPNDAVDWMVADDGHVWAGIRPNNSTLLSLWRFDGPKASVAFRVTEPSLEAGSNFVVGNEQDGLWLTTPDPPFGETEAPLDNKHLDVVKLDANTGKPTVEAQLPPLDTLDAELQTAQGQAAFSEGRYFLLQSPSVGGYTGFTQLLEVTPLP
jgi:hypothetical protein